MIFSTHKTKLLLTCLGRSVSVVDVATCSQRRYWSPGRRLGSDWCEWNRRRLRPRPDSETPSPPAPIWCKHTHKQLILSELNLNQSTSETLTCSSGARRPPPYSGRCFHCALPLQRHAPSPWQHRLRPWAWSAPPHTPSDWSWGRSAPLSSAENYHQTRLQTNTSAQTSLQQSLLSLEV